MWDQSEGRVVPYSEEDRESLRKLYAPYSTAEWVEGKSRLTAICRKCGTKFYASQEPAPCTNCGSLACKFFFYVDDIAQRVLPENKINEATGFITTIYDEDGKRPLPPEEHQIGRGLNPELRKNVNC
jgi:hypothetical protein